jgi:2-isopropylmalate synthase
VYETANLQLRPGQPFVGKSAFAHKGGMHAHAMALAPSSYEHIDPAAVGNSRRILISELSGRSNVTALANSSSRTLRLSDEMTKKVLAEVVRLEALGYQFEAAGASFELLVSKLAGEFKPHFTRIK